ncbi:LicD family protein [Lacticaseibacillus kribbianus]|uniref:LicD family protein n=1 Tax=Lacticaseibacillus kribbianus TaxID=2926292 RepID=UPI001CD5C7C9|nr:LicD family protein [Lacticaseibacillus kribbianus]
MEKETLNRLQSIETEMLKYVHDICVEHHLHYFMVGGTLLGAVRHSGFIPWDDDMDIALPRDDYQKLITVLHNKSSAQNPYWIQSIETQPDYWFPYAKLRKKHTVFAEDSMKNYRGESEIFIDIFPLDQVPKQSSFFQDLQALVIKGCGSVVIWRRLHYGKPPHERGIIGSVLNLLTTNSLVKIREKAMRFYNTRSELKYVSNLGSNYNNRRQTMPESVYGNGTLIKFGSYEFYGPDDSQQYLKQLFGDYLKLPPKDKRQNHNPVRVVFKSES